VEKSYVISFVIFWQESLVLSQYTSLTQNLKKDIINVSM